MMRPRTFWLLFAALVTWILYIWESWGVGI